ncbi:MAG TPA: hypothetical protein VK969_07365 [Acidimicrobiia bacterium]|nr:hypothetical protein [Acidimicrobiia bacterium]
MRRWKVVLAAVALAATACGGGGGDGEPSADADNGSSGDSSGGGQVVDTQPAGQAIASVDGQEFTLEVSPALDCAISDESITFAFWVGDNSVVLGGGANLYEDGWLGGIDLRISEPEGEPGPVAYFPDLSVDGGGIAIDGDSMSYSGPMMRQPPNDGSNPPPERAGDGTISVTCP